MTNAGKLWPFKYAELAYSLLHYLFLKLTGSHVGQVTELAALRSLLECLRESALRCSFSVSVLCDLAIQIADGMSYLEGRRLIHRDLAARNVLMFAKDKVGRDSMQKEGQLMFLPLLCSTLCCRHFQAVLKRSHVFCTCLTCLKVAVSSVVICRQIYK